LVISTSSAYVARQGPSQPTGVSGKFPSGVVAIDTQYAIVNFFYYLFSVVFLVHPLRLR
jgi:hypothetical protein